MSFMPLVIAELKLRAAELDVKAAQLNIGYPGESDGSSSRRYRNRQRYTCLARDYRRLAELAEAGE